MKANTQGFTLLEVLIAMALFAIAGVALLGTTANSANNLTYIEQKNIANWVAANQLVEASLSTKWPPQNNKKGKVEQAGSQWFWQQKVINTTDKNMRAVVIEVRRQEKDELPLASFQTYFAKPTK